jgi:demethylmenaquinone methyltransferase / 2-methoxy-6-polyprenyl-1,4-benzoquinol methylase
MSPGAGADRARYVQSMFTRIAGRYDLMNAVMTAGRHHAWRRATARVTLAAPDGPVLDLATGTGDLALAVRAARPGMLVVGADFSEGMLQAARPKLVGASGIVLLAADALALPFPDKTFAAVISAFLLRNLADLERGLDEMRRVTMPAGRVASLDIVGARGPCWGRLFGLYFGRVVPAMGAVLAGDREAYTYLPDSVDRFVTPAGLTRCMERAGLRHVTVRRFALGTVALHVGVV